MRYRTSFTKENVFVVLGCVVFLLASLGAAGSSGRKRAKEAVCLSNLLKWGVTFQTFANNHNGYFMRRNDEAKQWPHTLRSYYGHARLLLCPEAVKGVYEGQLPPFSIWQDEMEGITYRSSYVLNLWISNENDEKYWRTPYARRIAHAPMLLDGQWRDMQPWPQDEPQLHENDFWTPGPANEMRRGNMNRHNGGANAVFLDGSARKVGLKHLWRLKWYRNWPEDYPLPVWPEWMENCKDP